MEKKYLHLIPFSEFQFEVMRARGPGGQNVNKTNSAVVLRWSPGLSAAFTEEQKQRLMRHLVLTVAGEVIIRSDVHRVQDQNKSECLEKLDRMLIKALFVQKKRVKTKPTYSSKIKKLETKKKRAFVKLARQKVRHSSED
jgi:ribosome-associated protein